MIMIMIIDLKQIWQTEVNESKTEIKRLRNLALETLINMNPKYMREVFHKRAFLTHRPLNLEVN